MNRGTISATTQDGRAGSLQINQSSRSANQIDLNGGRLTVQSTGTGSSGNLTVNARNLAVSQGAFISASNVSGTDGGDIILQNLETLQVNAGGEISATTNNGQAGSLQINPGQTPANLVDLNAGKLTVEASGTGSSGNLTVNARNLTLQKNAEISASTNLGEGGNIFLQG